MSGEKTPFNRPYATGDEFRYIREAIERGQLSGNGHFTRLCHEWLAQRTGAAKVLLTTSCTAALEMSTLLADVGPGDEVILPSFTFVSTANAVVLRGATPVFVDIRKDTLNLDESLVERAITPKTKAVMAVHYAGVGCEMDSLTEICKRRGLVLLEDAAQGVLATYKGRALGTFGAAGALSFHETKNVISGEGGALLVNRPELAARAEILWEKGTNRNAFFRGEVDKYTWVDVGSSFLPSELVAAFLWAQMEQGEAITARRLELWRRYHGALAPLEAKGYLRRPIIPEHCRHNGHMYYVLFRSLEERTRAIASLKGQAIQAVFHYVPLHSAPAGKRFGRADGQLNVTDDLSERLLRLPLFPSLADATVDRVCEILAGLCV